MILDNADNSYIFFDRNTSKLDYGSDSGYSTTRLINFIPQVPHGTILVTSRNRTAAYALVGDYENIIKVDPLDEDKSLDLMKAKLSVDAVMEDDAKNLLKALEYVPLAITQASAYIRENAPMMTISRYFIEFLRNEANQATLLNKGAEDLRRDPDMPSAVITTWEISFRQIREQHEPAADLLSLMCLFNRQGIPEFLIREDDDHLAFMSAISPLINFSLVTAELGGEFFEMHRLVQIATRRWLESDSKIQEWKGKATRKMAESFPNGEYENWGTCEVLLPHAEEIIDFDLIEEEIQLQRATLLQNTAWYISARGNYDLAMQRSEQSLNIRRRFLHREDERVLVSMASLASTYRNQGRWREAEELEVQVMETRKRVLGVEHPGTLTSIANLASTFWNQGRWKEAEELQVQVMETRKRVLGVEHPDTLGSIANLALTYGDQGRWKEAEELEVQVMETSLRVLGAEHPSSLTSIANLASTFCNQGRWKEAEELEVQVMETSLRVLGVEHPDTLTSIANLATTYRDQGRWKEAEELQVQVMETRMRVLGAEHPDTLTIMNNLAHTYKLEDRSDQAIELMKHVVELLTKTIGANHPHTQSATHSLSAWTRTGNSSTYAVTD
jgi:tetratricopeptide (TPR) repeat protein